MAPEALGLFESNPRQIPMLFTRLTTVFIVHISPAFGLKHFAINRAVLATFVRLPFRVTVVFVVVSMVSTTTNSPRPTEP